MLSGKYPGVAKLAIPMVDVRDAALAHLRAAVEPEAKKSEVFAGQQVTLDGGNSSNTKIKFPNLQNTHKSFASMYLQDDVSFQSKSKAPVCFLGQRVFLQNRKKLINSWNKISRHQLNS